MKMNIGIKDEDRKSLSAQLGKLLADTYSVYLKTHFFHWNVTGPMFNTLHLLFEGQYTEMAVAVDDVAERIRALGEYAPGSYAAFARLSSIQDSEEVPQAEDMIAQAVSAHEALIRTARETVKLAEDVGDQVTADLATTRLRIHEKTAWMLRSFLV